MLEDNPDSQEAIKKQMDTLKKELEDLTKLISERYLNEDNPDCVEGIPNDDDDVVDSTRDPSLTRSGSTNSLGEEAVQVQKI